MPFHIVPLYVLFPTKNVLVRVKEVFQILQDIENKFENHCYK